jgi:hypothetical protein
MPQPTVVVYFPHMAPKKTTLKELGEMLAHVVKHMATKDDLAAAEMLNGCDADFELLALVRSLSVCWWT